MKIPNAFDAALDVWIEHERERLGGPPTPEEVVAYTRNELDDADAERVRALLVYYPELTDLLVPEVSRTWWQPLTRYMPLAAGVAIAVAALPFWRERAQPFVYETPLQLEPLRARGVAEPPVYELPAGETQYLLTLVTSTEYARVRVEILRGGNVVWETTATPSNGTITLSIPRKLIEGETHRIDLVGIDADGEHRADSYRVRVSERRR